MQEHGFTTFNRYTDPIPSLSLEPQTWCHLANKLKPYCKRGNCRNFHIWTRHRNHAARLLQTTPYDRPFLSNSWASI